MEAEVNRKEEREKNGGRDDMEDLANSALYRGEAGAMTVVYIFACVCLYVSFIVSCCGYV